MTVGMTVLACFDFDPSSFSLGIVTMTLLAIIAILWGK